MKNTAPPTQCLCLYLFFLSAMTTVAEKPLVVSASIPAQAWLIKQIAGPAVSINTFLTAGSNPHSFEPSALQVKSLANSQIYFTIGIPFETSLIERATQLNRHLTISAMDHGIQKISAHTQHHHHAATDHVCMADTDPHIWLTPPLMASMASNTYAALAQILPQNQTALKQKLNQTIRKLAALDAEIREQLKTAASHTWVVTHPSWQYFANTYDFKLLVLEQDGKAPSAKHLARLIKQAESARIGIIFTEPQFDPQPAHILAQQIGARVAIIDPLREDWYDLMLEVARLLGTKHSAPASNKASADE